MHKTYIHTPLGEMIAVADEDGLYMLEFTDRKNFERQFRSLPSIPSKGDNKILNNIRKDLDAYFKNKRPGFTTPYHLTGSEFQKAVWNALKNIPSGETRSYSNIAKSLKKPKAVRAIAGANAANKLAILIPCHRVIGKDGTLTGYAGGIERKEWLLRHEA